MTGDAAVVECLGEVGAKMDGVVEVCDGRVGTASDKVGCASVEEGGGVAGVEAEGLGVVGDGG